MELTFLGATHEVTGSCHYLKACGKNILIDCGLYQGQNDYDNAQFDLPPGQVDYVLLTHAHIDHSGRLPLLAKYGFRGEIHATDATCDLCGIMLRDSAHIQEFEAEWANRKGKRAGKDLVEPLYSMRDAETAIGQLVPHDYSDRFLLAPGVEVRFIDVGHLLGSASIEVWVNENGVQKKIAFSGDVGNLNQPLINDPAYIEEADYVVVESTYGTRLHNPPIDYCSSLAAIIQRTFDRGGNVVIPSFAVGRSQEVLYYLREIKDRGLIRGHEHFPVYLDSPLAAEATLIFHQNREDNFDFEAMRLVRQGINPISFRDLRISVSSDESKEINFVNEPKVIISASGMCEAGRIKHHLKHNLWRPESTILFVGYQAAGTTGRLIVDGAKTVKLFGEVIDVKAEVVQMEGMSGHADQAGLLRWLDAFSPAPKRVFVVHGETNTCQQFAQLIADRYKIPVSAPHNKEKYDLVSNLMLEAGVPRAPKAAAVKASGVFGRLLAAGQRLMAIIEKSRGRANKDLAKFADQIGALADKWDI